MFVKQIDKKTALQLAEKGKEVLVMVPAGKDSGWEGMTPDTLEHMPECCDMCRFSSQAYDMELFEEGECYCTISMESVDNISEGNKPSWCPIRPMPERKETGGNPPNPMIGAADLSFRMGWNDCIDSVEGRNGHEADS